VALAAFLAPSHIVLGEQLTKGCELYEAHFERAEN
jgi:hypothetical protein